MTTRVEWQTLLDRLAVDELISGYAAAVDDGDWKAYVALFAPDGRADYGSAGGIAGPAAEMAEWLASTMRLFPVRQHLIVNRRIVLDPPAAVAHADYVNPMRLGDEEAGPVTPNFVCGGRYTFTLGHTGAGWRIREVLVREKWRT
ncbi:nuclear transport factor 2 family protein [Streptomyces sp. NPDC026673]|uniref:nuclear transport factor 2 family protein n=1 Tax=Streptomyces sp. NPDC026673 TaxID=3155724 RepID=UPI0033C38D80